VAEKRQRRSDDPYAGAALRSPAPTASDADSERLRDSPAPPLASATAVSPAPSRLVAVGSSLFSHGSEKGPQAWICVTCGVQYPLSDEPPAECPICEDERQYVGWAGQTWTTMAELAAAGHRNTISAAEPGLLNLGTEPKIAIGQRALVVQTPAGNVMWDCITYVDDDSVAKLREMGGLAAIAISHPHFYSSMTSWSAAFGNCPIYIHASDEEFVQFRGPGLRLWEGDAVEVLPGVTLVNTRGHFPGATVLHWAAGADGRGALLTGDSITVVQDRRWVSFMYSYPNLIPLTDAEVRHIVEVLRPYPYERIYSAWEGRVTQTDGPGSVQRSAERYLAHR
jgi:hypothetical protein